MSILHEKNPTVHPRDAEPLPENRGDAWEDPRDRVGAPHAERDGRAPAGPATEAPKDEVHLTDQGNAIRLVKEHGADLRHCWPWRKWLVWDGARWRMDDTGAVVRCAKKTIANLFNWAAAKIVQIGKSLESAGDDEAPALKKQLAKLQQVLAWCLKSEAAARINAMLDLARSEDGIPILPEAMDRDPMLLNCVNGTLDLRTGKLLSHQQEDYLTKLCPVAFDAHAKAIVWERFIDHIFERKASLINFIQGLFGYALTGDVREQILPIFHGVGANGKSTLLNTILAVLGSDYGIMAARDLLLAKRNETHPTERADLFGKRLVVVVETDEGRRLAEGLVKDLTGGDRIRARRMPHVPHPDFEVWRPASLPRLTRSRHFGHVSVGCHNRSGQ